MVVKDTEISNEPSKCELIKFTPNPESFRGQGSVLVESTITN
jgi:hypothetical protein